MKKHLRHIIILCSVVFGGLLTDLLTKQFLFGTNGKILPYILEIRALTHLNTGAAWSFLEGHTWVFIVLAVVFVGVALFIDVKFKGKDSIVYTLGLGFILAGTIGNLADRIFVELNGVRGVRDFLFLPFYDSFPTFNFADMFLTAGCILLAVFLLFLYKEKPAAKNKIKNTNEDTSNGNS